MDLDRETPRADKLQKLPYSELRKVAKKHGITGKMKAEKLIAAIMSELCDSDEIFSTPSVKELNSSLKSKEKKFDQDQMTPLATPRRGTYSVESPTSVKTSDLSSVSLAVNPSVLDLSNVTISRGSERKLRPRKVSFMSPAMTPRTPRSQSLRNRPKTPIASRTSINMNVTSAQCKRKSSENSFSASTPHGKTVKFATNSGVESSSTAETYNSTPFPSSPVMGKVDVQTSRSKLSPKSVKSSAKKEAVREQISVKKGATPDFRRIHQRAFDKMESIDDYQKRKLLNSAKKMNHRPDLKSKVIKAKSKIPAFSGVPFISSASSTNSIKLKPKVSKKVGSVDKHKAAKENTPQSVKNQMDLKAKNVPQKRTPQATKAKFDTKSKNLSKRETPQSIKSKSKFDLKASLSRKLGYKPYKGPLKPLAESNNLQATSFLGVKEPVANKVVKENRLQTRSIIRGVRTNKRFELQMKNRKLD